MAQYGQQQQGGPRMRRPAYRGEHSRRDMTGSYIGVGTGTALGGALAKAFKRKVGKGMVMGAIGGGLAAAMALTRHNKKTLKRAAAIQAKGVGPLSLATTTMSDAQTREKVTAATRKGGWREGERTINRISTREHNKQYGRTKLDAPTRRAIRAHNARTSGKKISTAGLDAPTRRALRESNKRNR